MERKKRKKKDEEIIENQKYDEEIIKRNKIYIDANELMKSPIIKMKENETQFLFSKHIFFLILMFSEVDTIYNCLFICRKICGWLMSESNQFFWVFFFLRTF